MDQEETGRKLRIDFHAHTHYSKDSLTNPELLVRMCLRKGLDRVVVTDHNTIEGALVAHSIDPVHIIVGEEIMTTQGEILGIYVKENVPAGLSPLETIKILRDQKAFISVSHPFDKMRSGSWKKQDILSILPYVDAIEGFNARVMTKDANKEALSFADEHNLAITVGSDAHAAFEIGTASLRIPQFRNPEELKANIKQGELEGRFSPWWVHINSTYAKIHNNTKKG